MANSSTAQRVQMLVMEAEKKSTPPSGFFSSMFSGGPKYDEAADLFEKAANLHKVAQSWDLAADLLLRAADCSRKANYDHDAANHYVNASNCYKKSGNLERAKDCLTKATTYFAEQGKFSMAAKYQKELAEMAEKVDKKTAAELYQIAADYYESENSPTTASQCLLKVAEICAYMENYTKSIEIYQKVVATYLGNKLLKYGVKEYILLCIICYVCNDDVAGARNALARFEDMDYTFSSTREKTLCDGILSSVPENDVLAFTNAAAEFDNIQKLDDLKVTLLTRIKKNIKHEDDLLC